MCQSFERLCLQVLGRHGSDSLCRDERENKMAATYNVLALFRLVKNFIRPKTLRSTLWCCPILQWQGDCSKWPVKWRNWKRWKSSFVTLRFLLLLLSSTRLADLREQSRDQNTHKQSWSSPGMCLSNLRFLAKRRTIYIWRQKLDKSTLCSFFTEIIVLWRRFLCWQASFERLIHGFLKLRVLVRALYGIVGVSPYLLSISMSSLSLTCTVQPSIYLV